MNYLHVLQKTYFIPNQHEQKKNCTKFSMTATEVREK